MSEPTRSRAGERGSVAIEVVMLVPVLMLVALLTLQLGIAGWTASQTSEAARQSARAQSQGQDPLAAAERALPGSLRVERIETTPDSVTLSVKVPNISLLPDFRVERQVSIPRTS